MRPRTMKAAPPPGIFATVCTPDVTLDAVRREFPVAGPVDLSAPRADLRGAEQANVLLTVGRIGASRDAMARLPNLSMICCCGSGFEGVDLPAARDRGIVVAHCPDANASAVAEFAICLLSACVRQLPALHRFVADGNWRVARPIPFPRGRGIAGARVGIVGLGAIGRRIAARLVAMEAQVGYTALRAKPESGLTFFSTALDLAHWADHLVVACRADEHNRGLVGRDVIGAIGPAGALVNIARGSLVDEAALAGALAERRLGWAGLDVFADEPNVGEALRRLPNVILTPHVAAETLEAQQAVARMALENVRSHVAGMPVPYPVRPGAERSPN
ncbi:hydroxyacid dehydrogenase [Burkholderia sp. MSMB2042]|nr:hydroxyacid dehydrogenase [Burkholderia savannae]KVG43644.1 hydroxyacid dehydrogenase [Burkholderia sp. MSMB0265]KVG88806.1 hydroxyacid dehydrogenase [Burkholderia sp. MSMB2040]KVG92979.1 hydroxyacid dehydrogenase [Burkholderia sp. MSMB2042]KVH02116.1 hydroxyacid dehydrogenase [Burkholderia sp. MSMB2041]